MVLSVTTVFSLRRVWCRTWRSSYPGPIPQWCQPDVWGWSYTSISLVPDQFGMSYWQRPSRSARKHKQVWDQATLKWACCQTLCFSLLTHIRSLLIFFLIHIILSTHISLIVSFFPLRTVLVGWSRDRQRQQHHLAGPGDGIYEARMGLPGSHQRQHPQDPLFHGADGEGPGGPERGLSLWLHPALRASSWA